MCSVHCESANALDVMLFCQAVLKLDKTNYTALVFIGKCATELNQADQSLMAYKKAIESDETQPLAWQVRENITVQ